jgi:UDP-glucuronate 4-epimerase
MRTVLVTGGAGFIGSHTAERLLNRGDKVVIIDNMNDYYSVAQKEANLQYLQSRFGNSGRLRIYRGDICDKELVSRIFKEEGIELVCHLAARAGVRASIDDPFTYLSSNVEGTLVLLEQSRLLKIKNFVYASSSSVYGNDLEIPFAELDCTDKPISPYAATKKACEVMTYTYSHLYGLNCSGLRFFTVYGPRGRPDMAVFKFIDKIYNGVQIQRYGDGTTERDYTFVDDIVSGIVGAIDTPRRYEIYNLGNGNPVNLSRMIEIIESCLNIPANIVVLPKQPGDVDMTHADISRAQELLNYKPLTLIEDGLRKTVEWYLDEHLRQREKASLPSSAYSSCASLSSVDESSSGDEVSSEETLFCDFHSSQQDPVENAVL